MIEFMIDILKEQGPHFVIEAILLVAILSCVKSRGRAAKLMDEMHEKRMDDFDRAINLAERAKKLLNGHGDANDKD